MAAPRKGGTRRSRAELVELRRRNVPSTITYPGELPVSQRRDEIADAIRDHQVVIVAGETGSGKTTQLPKICLELGRGIDGVIGHTQPRRLAARTVADRIASELGVELGTSVGYAVRFNDRVSDATAVKLMTDGILLTELRHDRLLSRYDTIIVDEAHERSLNVDFILGYLVGLLPRRPDLKVIITSATIETDRFAAHFGGAPVIEVTGRTYPVELRYRPPEDVDPLTAIGDAVEELRREGPGDVLVFLSGEREIRDTEKALRELDLRDTEILPLYARLSLAEQHRVFASHRGRRIVLATNVAETSLTVPGIRYVIDPGTARVSRYSPRLKVQRLPIEPVSQASANQRAGRCGRVADGICIRLYDEDDFASRPEFTDPEILRTNLASVILQMIDIGLGDIEAFPFLDPPDRRAIKDGGLLLDELGALEPAAAEHPTPRLTKVGRKLARLPVDPRFARMVLEAGRTGCLREALVIVAALSIQDPRERPAEHAAAADQFHARFKDDTSDFLAYLQLWSYLRAQQRELSSNQFRKRCRREHLNFLRVREWQDVHAQLKRVAHELDLPMNTEPAAPDTIHRALLAGLLSHVGQKHPETRDYTGARNARFAIFPGSSLAKKPPDWVMAAELVETSRLWARTTARIDPAWLEPLAEHLVKRSYSEPHWSTKRGAAMVHERVTLYGLPIVADRRVNYATIDPDHARELFIQHGLVEGDWHTKHSFIAANRELLVELEDLEHRFRRRDLVAGDTLERLYDERIPERIANGRQFDNWWKKARRDRPDQLTFGLDDLIDQSSEPLDEDAFPAEWHQGRLRLGLSYAFEPGTADDGVAVHIPVAVLNQTRDEGFDWLVPGLREELVVTLIRSLPRALRRGLLPIQETAHRFLETVEPMSEPLRDALARELTRVGGEPISRDAWDLATLPPHLRLLYLVVDDDDTELARGEDLEALKRLVAGDVRQVIAEATADIERDGLTAWTFGALPQVVERERNGQTITGFPALIDRGETVSIRVLDNVDEQHAAMWDGTRRLVRLAVPVPIKAVQAELSNEERLQLAVGVGGRRDQVGSSPYTSFGALLDDCITAALDDILATAGGVAWDATGFERLTAAVRRDLQPTLVELVREVAALLHTTQEVDRRLRGLAGGSAEAVRNDIAAQRDALVYDGFVSAVGRNRVADVARYVAAMIMRLDKLAHDPRRDRQRMEIVHRLQHRLDLVMDDPPGGALTDDLIDIAWLLEELRVSLFAQSIGTPVPTSEERVARAIERFERSAAAPTGPTRARDAR